MSMTKKQRRERHEARVERKRAERRARHERRMARAVVITASDLLEEW